MVKDDVVFLEWNHCSKQVADHLGFWVRHSFIPSPGQSSAICWQDKWKDKCKLGSWLYLVQVSHPGDTKMLILIFLSSTWKPKFKTPLQKFHRYPYNYSSNPVNMSLGLNHLVQAYNKKALIIIQWPFSIF